MGRASDLSERLLVDLVRSGEWEIDAQGRVWRNFRRRGNKHHGGFRLDPCERSRAEKPTPAGYLQVRMMVDGRAAMRCETCRGTGWVPANRGMLRYFDPAPCRDCGGSGIISCCDGLCGETEDKGTIDNGNPPATD